jgi:hypothetical protein
MRRTAEEVSSERSPDLVMIPDFPPAQCHLWVASNGVRTEGRENVFPTFAGELIASRQGPVTSRVAISIDLVTGGIASKAEVKVAMIQ